MGNSKPNKDYQNIAQIISNSNPTMIKLISKSKQLTRLNNLVQQCLPKQLSEISKSAIHVCDYYQGIIKISVPNPSIATQLRNQSKSLLEQINRLSTSNINILSLQFKILANTQNIDNISAVTNKKNNKINKNNKNKITQIKTKSRDQIKLLANHIKHKGLAAALKQLAKK